MKENWCRELTEGFVEVKCIDAKDKKTSRKFVLLSLLISVIVLIPFAIPFFKEKANLSTDNILPTYFIFLGTLIIQTVIHELIHGAVYKITTHQKLTFGLTLTVAFCGVPDIYVKRRAAFYSILAPFVVLSIVFGTGLILMEHSVAWYFLALIFCIHIGGCVGDLWGALYMATHYKDKTMFVKDTGPKQTFYVND